MLSEDQVEAFAEGGKVRAEAFSRGKRGAFFVHSDITLRAQADRRRYADYAA